MSRAEIYYDYYQADDHAALAAFIAANMADRAWIVSYDNVAALQAMYADFRSIVYDVGYSARESRIGKEVMFFAPTLTIPPVAGPIKQVGPIREAA